MASDTRIEKDSLGEVEVPVAALYGAQTQRAVDNFTLGGGPMPAGFIASLGLIKAAAARANARLGELDEAVAGAIYTAAMAIAQGEYLEQFPVDVYQTGSGTSSNMNANEVIARLAGNNLGRAVHPNDHVNCGQSSNDVIPTAIHLSASLAVQHALLPALQELEGTIRRKEKALEGLVKTGRTHLMDAMPISFAQELSAWRAQFAMSTARLRDTQARLCQLAQGGTAVGDRYQFCPGFRQGLCRGVEWADGPGAQAGGEPVRRHQLPGYRGGIIRPAQDPGSGADEVRQ